MDCHGKAPAFLPPEKSDIAQPAWARTPVWNNMEKRKYVSNGVRAPDHPARDKADIRHVFYENIYWNVFVCSLLQGKMYFRIMAVYYSSKTSVSIYQATRCHNTEDRNINLEGKRLIAATVT